MDRLLKIVKRNFLYSYRNILKELVPYPKTGDFNLEKQLLTMVHIAKQLNLAESTARLYRDRFENFNPSVDEGRKKRYKPETVEVL